MSFYTNELNITSNITNLNNIPSHKLYWRSN